VKVKKLPAWAKRHRHLGEVLTMEDCLAYFKSTILDIASAIPWDEWWKENADCVRACFAHEDYLRLKFHKRSAAREILIQRGLISASEGLICAPLDGDTHCRYCGAELFRAIPGKTTSQEIIDYAERTGREDIKRDAWIHPGVYCPNGCAIVLHEIRQ
jgi:hypothetical protein